MNTSPPPESSSRSAAAPTRTTPGTIVIGSTCWAVMTLMIADPQTPRPSCVYYCTLRTLAPAIQHTKVHVKALDARLGALPCQESWPGGGVANGLAWLLDHGAMLSDLIRTVERPSTAGATDADHQRAARPRIAVRSTSDSIDRRYLLGMVTLPDTQTGAHSGLCAASSASGVVRRRRRAGVPVCAPRTLDMVGAAGRPVMR